MSAEQNLDRNENATPFKLEEARKRGSVYKSRELISLGYVVLAMVACFSMADDALRHMALLMRDGLTLAGSQRVSVSTTSRWISHLVLSSLSLAAPLLASVVVVAVALTLLTSGVVFSSTPLKPDWSRLNPVTGFKRLFSVKLLYEAVKSVLLLMALVCTCGLVLRAAAESSPRLFSLPPCAFLFEVVEACGSFLGKLVLVIAAFALIDVLFTRWDYLRSLRMSRRDIEDETKHRDGDPRIKARLRELRLEHLRRSRSVSRASGADVLVTNPSHIAIALRYQRENDPAPQVIAKGAGSVALRMREVANRAGVPIVPNPPLARALFKDVEADHYVPERWYPQLARILVWAQSIRQLQRERGTAMGSRNT